MAIDHTQKLNLAMPDEDEQYNRELDNENLRKIDNFASLVPERALTADKLTIGKNINGIKFDGTKNIISGLGLYSESETYKKDNIVYNVKDGEINIYLSMKDNNLGNELDDESSWQEISLGGSGSEIGDIGFAFLGIDESDNKRRYLNGQVIMQNEFEAFTLWVKKKIELYPNAVCSENEWQNEVQTSIFHQCGKVVINDEDGTIRLPKVVNIQGCQDLANNLGVRLPESLPNIKGPIQDTFSGVQSSYPTYGPIRVTRTSDRNYSSTSGSDNGWTEGTFDASRSSSTYQDNAPVQQEAIQYPFYIQVAKGGKRSVDATEEYTINNPFSLFDSKYDTKDISNASWLNASTGSMHDGTLYPSAYEEILRAYNSTKKIGNADVKGIDEAFTDYDFRIDTANQEFRLPLLDGSEDLVSERYIDLKLGATGSTYTAPANGWFNLDKNSSSSGQYAIFENGKLLEEKRMYGNDHACIISIPCKKGDSILLRYTLAGTFQWFRFIYAEGNGNLYYYVGETVENPNLINAGQTFNALSKKADKTEVDGQWVYLTSNMTIISSLTLVKDKIYTYDISSFLPNDEYNYELILSAGGYTGAASGNTANIYVASDLNQNTGNRTLLTRVVTRTSSTATWGGSINLIVSKNRQVHIINTGSADATNASISLNAYRRLGTNQ